MGESNGNEGLNKQQEIEDQQACALLRERFLRLISHLSGGQSCKLRLYDHQDYSCRVRGFNPSFENIIVENLVTPYPQPIAKAIIRISDVISMHFEVDDLNNYN